MDGLRLGSGEIICGRVVLGYVFAMMKNKRDRASKGALIPQKGVYL